MSYSEDYDWRCMNCGGFHECGNCPYYEDQSWKNQPRTCWEGYENSNSWNPTHHQCYGEYEHQPFVQEESHQRRKNQKAIKSIEEMLESIMIQFENNLKYQETMLKSLSDGNNAQEAQLMQVSVQGCVKCGSPHCGERCLVTIAEEEARIEAAVQKRLAQRLQEEAWIEAAVQERLAQRLLEGFMDRIERNFKDQEELQIEERYAPQVLEEDEEVESLEEASDVVIELECEKMVERQKEQVVGYDDLKEVPIVDFVFGDKLMINKEKPLGLSIYLMKLWSKGAHDKEQTRGEAIVSTTWKKISKNLFNSLALDLIFAAMISEYACNVMILLCKNLHDLSGLKQFAIDPG